MEIGSREWLIVGAIIFILLIVVDGWRRMRAQSNSLKIDIDDKLAELGEDNYNPELPLGAARAYVPKDTDKKNGANFSHANQNNTQSAQSEFVQDKAHADKDIAENPLPIADALANAKQAIQANIAQELNKTQHSFNSLKVDDDQFDVDSLSMLGNADGIIGSKRAVQNKEQQSSDATSSDSYSSAIDSSDVVLTDDITIADQPADEEFAAHKEPLAHKKPLAQTDPAEPEAEKVPEQLEQPDYVDENNTDLSELTIPDILKAKPQPKTAEQTDPQQSVDDESRAELSDTEQSIKSMSEHDESIPSSRDFSADMFEMLLEERDSHNNLERNDAQTDDIEQHGSDDIEVEHAGDAADDEQPSFSLTDEAKQQEIAALKARLKQLSNEDDIDHSDEQSRYTKKAVDKEKESIEQVLKNATSDDQTDSDSDNIANDDELEAEQLKDQVPEQDETRVVDDEVDLEDIEQDLISRSNKDELNTEILQKLNALNNADSEPAVSEKNKEVELKVTEFESVALQGLSANDDLDEHDFDESVDDSPVFDDAADPLMDGYDDSRSSKELVEQFNHDLAVDDQAVSNELDMPISEILKKKIQSQQSPANTQAVDPLLDSSDSVDDIPAGIDDIRQDLEDNSEREQQTLASIIDEDDSFDEPAIANNLGFSAFDDDPLMANFEDPYEDAQTEEENSEDEKVEDQKLATENEQALTNQSALSDTEKNDDDITLETQQDKQAAMIPAKKPRKLIANVDDPEVVLIVTVVAKDSYLDGAALKQVVEACGMEFGDMDVFHRFEDGQDKGAIQFSMTNAVNPGTFDIATMAQSSTPGVSFFMSMDEPLDAKNALDCMLATAETVANHLNGNLLDDDRSVLRPQTKEHYKERIRIHEMKKLHRRN
jgi:cell division protein ZipA